MKLSAKLLAIGLALGIVATPAAVSAQPGHDRGRHNGWHKGNDRHYGNGHRYRGHRGRRVCRTERHHGQRVTRCFYR